METTKPEQALWRRFAPDLGVILWGLVGGILIPLLVNRIWPREMCDSPYLLSLRGSSWPFWFLLSYPLVGITTGVAVAVWALKGRPAWLMLVYGPITLGLLLWMLSMSCFFGYLFLTLPQVKDQLVVDGKQYALVFCASGDLEGGDVGLYQCDNEKLRSCHLLTRGCVGMMQDPSLRYEDGNLIIDDTCFGTLIYPLDGE